MRNIESVIESKMQNMFLKYPDQKELSIILFEKIVEMIKEDFDAISQKNKRVKLVYKCIICILEKAREQNVKKQYAIDLLDIFLDKDIMLYLNQKLEKNRDDYTLAIKSARSELYCSQWSDTYSSHWQRAIRCLEKF